MEKKRNVIQVYAIIVNVGMIIAFIIATTSLISALIERNDPLYSGYSSIDLSSFEKYKIDVLKSTKKEDAFIPSDKEIMKMYEDAKTNKINKVLHDTFRTIVVSAATIVISLGLFLFHWKLAKSYDQKE